MPNTLLTRIDNRLVHGQVAIQWNGSLDANLILIANDAISGGTMRQQLLNTTTPTGVRARFFSIEKTIEAIYKASERQKIFLLIDNLVDALHLVDGGMPVEELDIGNMCMEEGKRRVATAVAANKTDVDAFKKLQELDIKFSIQHVLSTPEENLGTLFSWESNVGQ